MWQPTGYVKALAIVLAPAFLATFPLHAQECPGGNQIRHSDGAYVFSFESWVKAHPGTRLYYFGRCVDNLAARGELFVDWKGTNVRGWARWGRPVESGVSASTNRFGFVDTVLWYGSRPDSILAPFMTPLDPGARLGGQPLHSWVRMAVPTNVDRPSETLVDIHASFHAGVVRVPGRDGYMYYYLWQSEIPMVTSIRIGWQSESVLRAIREMEVPEPLILSEDVVGVLFWDNRPPVYAEVALELLDADGRVGGSTGVAIYHPEGDRP